MVDFVDIFVEEGGHVHGTMGPVVPRVFHDEEDGDLGCHGPEGGEGDRGGETEVLRHWVEKPDRVSLWD